MRLSLLRMAPSRALALISSPASLAALPPDALILPLRPGLAVPREQLVAARPEDLLAAQDTRRVLEDAETLARTWAASRLAAERLTWGDVPLAACFEYDLRMVAVDLLKTARIVTSAREHAPGSELYTDAPLTSETFPPYPYLSAVGPILAQAAEAAGGRVHGLRADRRPRGPRTSRLGRMYSGLTARQGAARLRRPDVLVALGPYPDDYRPVARAWKSDAGETVVVAPQDTPVRASAADSLSFVALEALVDRATRATIDAFVERAVQAVRLLDLGGPRVSSGYDLRPILRGELEGRLRERLAHLAMMGVAFETRLDTARGLLLMETVSPLAHAAILFARRHRVPATVVQHGVLAGAFSYRQTAADRIAAWGSSDATWFRGNLPGQPRVEATGSPRYDRLIEAGGPSYRAVPGLPADRPIVLFVSQPLVQDDPARSAWSRWDALQMAVESGGRGAGFVLVVKWHPAEEPDPLPSPEMDATARLVHHADTLALLERSRVVLAISSTAALEAMYLDRPVVFLGPADPGSPFHPPEDGAGPRALDGKELARTLDRLVPEGPARKDALARQRAFLASHYAPLDGKAATRVAALARGG